MKKFKYGFLITLSVLIIIIPLLFLLYALVMENWNMLIPAAIALIVGFIVSRALGRARQKSRQDVEYDEFGLSKTKGKYENLSKAERDAIDLQRTADMERVLNTTAVKKMLKKGSENPEKDLEEMIGLEPIKQKMREMAARMEFEQQENKRGKKQKDNDSMSGRHMVFYGSPGTGKTTVARIIAGFLYEYGFIKQNKCVEVDGNFLKAGQDTALKTEMIIRQALDGVLFIDEAYALMETGDGTGEMAIATLIKQMEDNRGRFIIILAGYTNEMKRLLAQNPGFESRIKEYLDFPDYSDEEMLEIFKLMAKHSGFEVDYGAYQPYTERIKKERRLRSFGNARTARNVLDETIDRHSLNFIEGKLGRNDKYVIKAIDVSPDLKRAGFN